jgi:hypothetical protein
MRRHRLGLRWLGMALLVGASGCAKPAEAPPVDEGAAVRARFEEFQKTLGEHDADRLWAMLSRQSRDEAERAARVLRAEYEKADAKKRAEQEKTLGLSGAELAKLTGRDFLKTRRFEAKYKEAREGKFERVSAQGDTATVYFVDDEGDREKILLLREEGQWQLWLKMPGGGRRTADEEKEDQHP